MGQSVLVFVSHSSEDKENFIEPLVADLESCYINVWLDKRKILPGDNLRQSIFRDGLDKADIALIFFTQHSLQSSWVDREIKHVLREDLKKGNDFNIKKIISIFDSQETYNQISERYPELTDDLLHLMPSDYNKVQFGQLISAIWSKYFSLQGGDVETQRQLLSKEKEIFQKEKEIETLKKQLQEAESNSKISAQHREFIKYVQSGKIDELLDKQEEIFKDPDIYDGIINGKTTAIGLNLLGLKQDNYGNNRLFLTPKGKAFFEWYIMEGEKYKKKDEPVN